MKRNKIILLIGRENLEKDSYLYTEILSQIKGTHLDIFNDYSLSKSKFWLMIRLMIPTYIRRLPFIKSLFIRVKETLYSIFLNPIDYSKHLSSQKNSNDIPIRIEKLAQRLKKIHSNTEITLIGRSAGAIVATMVSLNHPIHKIIALGYPFKHPDCEEENYRYAHLIRVKTPMLIIQGLQDIYGGKEILEKYKLNVNTNVVFEDINHDFELTEENRIKILRTIEEFIEDATF
jgi:hypothetical protein